MCSTSLRRSSLAPRNDVSFMNRFTAEGIIIKRRNIGEADRILTVLTKEQGKIQVKAKGVRKIPSRRASHIELLNYSQFTLYKGQFLPILTEAHNIETFADIKCNLKKVGIAYHVCEIIDGLCPENQEHRQVFYLFKDILEKLASHETIFPAIHAFEISLLQELGYVSSNDHLNNMKPSLFIENILEKKLKSRQILPQLL